VTWYSLLQTCFQIPVQYVRKIAQCEIRVSLQSFAESAAAVWKLKVKISRLVPMIPVTDFNESWHTIRLVTDYGSFSYIQSLTENEET